MMNTKMIRTADGGFVNKAVILDAILDDTNFERVLKEIIILGSLAHVKNLVTEFAEFTRDIENVNKKFAICDGEICLHFKKYFHELDNTVTTHRNKMKITYFELHDMVDEFSRDPESDKIMNNLKREIMKNSLRG